MKQNAYKEMYENELTHSWYIETRNLMVDILGKRLKKEDKILDAGCGTGGTLIFLKKAGFRNIVGIDNSKIALDFCKKRALGNVKLASVNKIPFGDKSFDAVVCLDVLYHVGVKPEVVLREFNRILKNKGLLYIQEPSYEWLKSKHDRAIQTQHRFNKKELESLLKLAEFKICKSSYYNMFLLPLIIFKRISNKMVLDNHSDVYKLSPFINIFMSKIMKLESIILKTLNLPFGLSLITLAQKKA